MDNLNIGDEVYDIDISDFGIIRQINETKYVVCVESCGINISRNRNDLIPIDESKLGKDEPHLTTFTMAGRIPGMIMVDGKPSLIVAVGSNERNIPHFHIFRNNKDLNRWENGACLMFTENRYFDHGSRNCEFLTKYEINALNMKLKPIHKEYKIAYWRFIIDLWNASMPNYQIPKDLPITTYDYKTIKKYKEE